MTTHTVFKWVPNVTNAGPTMWTVNDAAANASSPFTWKGGAVTYHRDGTKISQATDTLCGVTAPQFSNNIASDGTASCSVDCAVHPGRHARDFTA